MITPIENCERLSSAYEISLMVKRDDLFPFTGGGNKARKIKFIVEDAKKKGANALVTAGSANSNHARVVALAGANLGWPVHIIIHDSDDSSKGNLQLMRLAGASLEFVELKEVAAKMDKTMEFLRNRGFSPYYIYGGGHGLPGALAYFEAVQEFREQANGWYPDYVVHASGMGSTQAGLHTGFSKYYPKTEVFGISVARNMARGKNFIRESVSELHSHLKIPASNRDISFFDEWTGGGYEKIYPSLINSIKVAAKLDGLITDPTYTGKAITAILEMSEKSQIEKGSKVLFWHTGGLINLLTSNHHF